MHEFQKKKEKKIRQRIYIFIFRVCEVIIQCCVWEDNEIQKIDVASPPSVPAYSARILQTAAPAQCLFPLLSGDGN